MVTVVSKELHNCVGEDNSIFKKPGALAEAWFNKLARSDIFHVLIW